MLGKREVLVEGTGKCGKAECRVNNNPKNKYLKDCNKGSSLPGGWRKEEKSLEGSVLLSLGCLGTAW